METFKNSLEIIALLIGFGGVIYHIATIKSNIYRTIDTTCDFANQKINKLEKQLELHLSEYKQQVVFNKERSDYLHQDIDEKFQRLYEILDSYREIYKQLDFKKDKIDNEDRA